MKLSIVTTLYQSAPYVKEFCQRAGSAAEKIAGEDFEIILVNDGSTDNSLEIAVHIANSNHKLIVVDLSRNFGHHKALLSGLQHSQGEIVFLIDSDLEEEPEWLLAFYEKMKQQRNDSVFGVQINRKGGQFEKWSGHLYYKIISSFFGINLPANVVTARLMTRQFVDELLRHEEREMFLGGLYSIIGFDQAPLRVKKYSTSETTYSIRRKLSLTVNSITAFSNVPLKIVCYCGLMISTVSVGYVAYLIIRWYFFASAPSGWTSVIASIWLLGGLIISFLGVMGIYLSKIFIEVKRRPNTIVRRIYGRF
jgi:putative glycosyltransferase